MGPDDGTLPRALDPAADPRTMLGLESRPSDSPHVARVWRSTARGGPMTSVAATQREIVFWWENGVLRAAVRGPETVPSELEVPAGHTSFGIVLTHGAVLPWLPAATLVDSAVESPGVTSRGVVLAGEEVPVPGFDTAEMFVDRLVRWGLLTRDPLVDDVLAGDQRVPCEEPAELVDPTQPPTQPPRRTQPTRPGRRTVERRVRAATGLTRGAVGRIERVRQAAILLGEGVAPLDVVGRLGFHDHPHLAHALTRYVGYTAIGLRAPRSALSLLYKVDDLPGP